MMKLSVILSGSVLAATLLVGGAFAQSVTGSGPPKSDTVQSKPGSEDVVISGPVRRAQSPDGDPRSQGQIKDDQRTWDRCVLSVERVDMHHPVDSSPEEYCGQRLGMIDRDSVPVSVKNSKNP